jgi:hypothetical protein
MSESELFYDWQCTTRKREYLNWLFAVKMSESVILRLLVYCQEAKSQSYFTTGGVLSRSHTPTHDLSVWAGKDSSCLRLLGHWDHDINNNSVALVRERTIPTERPPLFGELVPWDHSLTSHNSEYKFYRNWARITYVQRHVKCSIMEWTALSD